VVVTQTDGHSDGLRPDDIDLDSLLAGLQNVQDAMAKSTQRMALQTTDAWSRDGLAHVWVNARGAVIQAELDDELFSRSNSTDVAAAIVEASQAAAVKMGEQVATFQSGLWQELSALGLPDVQELTQIEEFKRLQPQIPLSAPGSRERRAATEALGAEPVNGSVSEDADDWGLRIHDRG
jgi:DNA-binding protein YbaB